MSPARAWVEADASGNVTVSPPPVAFPRLTLSPLVALVCGFAAVIFGGALYFWWRPLPLGRELYLFSRAFAIGWPAVCIGTIGFGSLLRGREARLEGERFFSTSLNLLLQAVFPALAVGASSSTFFVLHDSLFLVPPVLMLCYGLALLALRPFAPPSLVRLAWCFVLAGAVSVILLEREAMRSFFGKGGSHVPTLANLLIVGTFGFFHLIYAACTWPRAQRRGGANP